MTREELLANLAEQEAEVEYKRSFLATLKEASDDEGYSKFNIFFYIKRK